MPPFLLPLLLVAGAAIGGYALYQAARGGMMGPGAAAALADRADALAILNFPPYSLTQPPRPGSVAFLAPAGIDEATARQTLAQFYSGRAPQIEGLRVVRGGIPIPVPGGVAGPPAYADLWLANTQALGPDQGKASVTVTPETIVLELLRTPEGTASPLQLLVDSRLALLGAAAPPGTPAPNLLAALLYAAALAGDPLRKVVFLPVAAVQG